MMKKCLNCRSTLVDKNGKPTGGVQCAKCKKNQEKYGKPGVCKYCQLQAAFVDEKCVHCCHGERKLGPPVECSKCKLKSAFVKNGSRSDKAIMCRLCDMTANEIRQKDKDKEKSSTSATHRSSSSSKPHSSTSKHASSSSKPSSTSTSHQNKRHSTGSGLGQPHSKLPKQVANSAGSDEQVLLVQQLRSEILDLKDSVKSKEQTIHDRDKKIAELSAEGLRKDKDGRAKQTEMQKRFDDQADAYNEKIRNLQKQLAQCQKQLNKALQNNDNKSSVTTVVLAATAPPLSSTKSGSPLPLAEVK